MHIIKITPVSFKIILSKQDLMRHGVENIFDHTDISGDFFAEIIDRTNKLYGNPFTEGSLNAEFFESKDGGGELFISSTVQKKNTTYIFTTSEAEALISLCTRLYAHTPSLEGDLYYDGEKYSLVIFAAKDKKMLLPSLAEYGYACETGRFDIWRLEEHAKKVLCGNAIETIAEKFTS